MDTSGPADTVTIALVVCGDFGEYMAEIISRMAEFRNEAALDSSVQWACSAAARTASAPD